VDRITINHQGAFGKEEGGRLDSQIILSRNQTKYTQGEEFWPDTALRAAGRNSELRAILEKARRRSEKKKAAVEDQVKLKDVKDAHLYVAG
jgi:hypothetical protein